MKPGHDGTVAAIDANSQKLLFSYEAEKDSFPRYEVFNPALLLDSAQELGSFPDVFAISGWSKAGLADNAGIGAGYFGIGESNQQQKETTLFGQKTNYFSSTHAASHIWSSYGMSPFEQGQPCYALIWEGALGDFYEIDENLNVTHLGNVMMTPGNKYSFLYALADPSFTLPKGQLRYGDPGKLMALCAFGQSGKPSDQEWSLIDSLLNRTSILKTLEKDDLADSPYYNIGLLDPQFTQLAKRFSDELFKRFHAFAKENLTKGYPLLISGGCGLNCDWNTAWKNTELFEDIFIPPCTNDTGSAIGTAIDAMRHFTGKAKVEWSVYSGQDYIDDQPEMNDVETFTLDIDHVADMLAKDHVIAWAKGKCEIGPRALGNRSLIAAPFSEDMQKRLNKIKRREGFRPIAPFCLEEDVSEHFDWTGPSEYMLHFQKVKNNNLKAITHVDNTARVQTVNHSQNENIHSLLSAFKNKTGTGVLCNTSLNFNGTGFINRTSDLYHYCKENKIDGFVYANKLCMFKGS